MEYEIFFTNNAGMSECLTAYCAQDAFDTATSLSNLGCTNIGVHIVKITKDVTILEGIPQLALIMQTASKMWETK